MKRFGLICLLLSMNISLMAQQNEFDKYWKQIKSLEEKGLIRDACEVAEKIYALAVSNKNDAQQIKSSLYLLNNLDIISEQSITDQYLKLCQRTDNANGVAKNIWYAVKAIFIQRHISTELYEIKDRTPLANEDNQLIETWSPNKYRNEIIKNIRQSLENPALLQQTGIETYTDIIKKGTHPEMRPTMYDLLADHALRIISDFTYAQFEQSAMNAFEIDQPIALSTAKDFAQHSFEPKNTNDPLFTALEIYQAWITFHLKDTDDVILYDIDLQRLEDIYANSNIPEKDALYLNSLKQITINAANKESKAMAAFTIAQWYHVNQNKAIMEGDSTFNLKAFQFAQDVVTQYPGTYAADLSTNLITQIIQPQLSFKTEEVLLINKPALSLLTYKNLTSVHLKIVPINDNHINRFKSLNYPENYRYYLSLKPLRTWSVILNDPGDYNIHRAEFKIDPLPAGSYLLLISDGKNFNADKNIVAGSMLQVSNIGHISDNAGNYYIMDRFTGLPLQSAIAEFYENNYNKTTKKQEFQIKYTYTSNKDGHFKITNNGSGSLYLHPYFRYKNDFLDFRNSNEYFYFNPYKTSRSTEIRLFTDRSIYRPGQTVYFKGIVIDKDSIIQKSKVKTKQEGTITLMDANYVPVQTFKYISNEMGSFSGSFVLPESGLTGNYTLTDSSTNYAISFSVEAYKRPNFKTTIGQPEGQIALNDTVSVNGQAIAYNGTPISFANVTYRIVRTIQYPWRYNRFDKYIPHYNSTETEIAYGNTQTLSDGSYEIKFKAIPGKHSNKLYTPIFNFTVYADVTDINGETRSAQTNVPVSSIRLFLNPEIPASFLDNQLDEVKLKTQNIHGSFSPALIQVDVYKSKMPEKYFRERLWEVPDQFTMTKTEFESHFPEDVYHNEDDPTTWPIENKIFSFKDSTRENGKLKWPSNRLQSGWYKIVFTTTDDKGEPVTSTQWIQIRNPDKTTTPIELQSAQKSAEPGEYIRYKLQTPFDKVWVIQTINRPINKSENKYITLQSGKGIEQQIRVLETDRGGISIQNIFIHNNRVYTAVKDFIVPWINKELQVKVHSWRDKILPGSEQTFSLQIDGSQSDSLFTEALVTMYDASLDQFIKYDWITLKSLWPGLFGRTYWNVHGYSVEQSVIYFRSNPNFKTIKPVTKSFLDIELKYYIGIARSMKLPSPNAEAAMSLDLNDNEKENEEIKKKISYTGSEKTEKVTDQSMDEITLRKNFHETAFFYPHLMSDKDGNIHVEFKTPEALTTWKLRILAHNTLLQSAYEERMTITSLPLMAQAQLPRFVREGDRLEIPVKISNTTDSTLSGIVQLSLYDGVKETEVDGWFQNVFPLQHFSVEGGLNQVVYFPVQIPAQYSSALMLRVKAITSNGLYSDGEEQLLPVAANRVLVTETVPFTLNNEKEKKITVPNLLNSGNSTTLQHERYTLQVTTNPLWEAVLALPYLMEYPYDCNEQLLNKLYAHAISNHLIQHNLTIKNVIQEWMLNDTTVFASKLHQNESLKNALLTETPWVVDAQNEAQQRKKIAQLLHASQNEDLQTELIQQLLQRQSPNGAFSWFQNGPSDRYITQYILTGIGKLCQQNILDGTHSYLKQIITNGLLYTDEQVVADYKRMLSIKNRKDGIPSDAIIQYMYMRSFYSEKMNDETKKAYAHYLKMVAKFWNKTSLLNKASIAIILNRNDNKKTALQILNALKQTSVSNKEMGIYWKALNEYSTYSSLQPVEVMAQIISAFTEITPDDKYIAQMKVWLLQHKHTNNWKTTKATADACYVLLTNAEKTLTSNPEVIIRYGNNTVSGSQEKQQAGTSFFEKIIPGTSVKSDMGNIEIKVQSDPTDHLISGGVYWQYFEQPDKTRSAGTPLSLEKEYFVQKNTEDGPVLTPITSGDAVKTGDKIVVRIILRSNRDMDYVHLKDMRIAGSEPVNVLSGYKYQSSLGYYESTGDMASNFFIDHLRKGTYVFEYTLFATHTGTFSTGIAQLQCMYAPEFSAHSNGAVFTVEE